ncbi:MAG: hypothetical protein PVJ43_04970 [Gemmatimonadales bacterium]|jgi:hypothetical protein
MSDDVSRDVDQLLKDREKYESWLERLESQRSGASARAFERVLGDYQQRLEDVLRQLQSHSDSIKAKLTDLGHQVAALEKERTGRAEELDEARLRRAVGEYGDDTDWQQLEQRLLGALQETEGRIEAIRGETRRLEEIIAVVERPAERPAAPEPLPEKPALAKQRSEKPAAPKPPPEEPAEPEPEAGPAVVAEERPVTSTLPPEVIEVTEEEPLDSAPEPPPLEAAAAETGLPVAPKPEPRPAEHRPPPAPPEPDTAEVGAGDGTDEGYLSLGELVLEDSDWDDVLGEPARAEPEVSPEPEPRPEGEAEEGAEVGDELAFLESLSLGADEESESFSFLAQRGSGTPQTIICPHCSAANDPAEWYCTECGEELPAE